MIFARKLPEFYLIIARKKYFVRKNILSDFFFLGGGHLLPSFPLPSVYYDNNWEISSGSRTLRPQDTSAPKNWGPGPKCLVAEVSGNLSSSAVLTLTSVKLKSNYSTDAFRDRDEASDFGIKRSKVQGHGRINSCPLLRLVVSRQQCPRMSAPHIGPAEPRFRMTGK